ncbi:hypothetical protein UFOVP245_114 [uncultured Caudovirales phage]|uniref:BppU N-terminal domain-containing protein n=1 Tax=uncultured Caudovirales phage TaxID=2100421 RepID=A0A6J7WWL3_9CAUD|nr:hypothetical protein UFOVP245_114 [uncultured Caudovirales phage]
MSIKTNLIIDQGANFVYKINLIDQSGNPFNISGYTANAQIRKTYTSTTYNTITCNVAGSNGVVTLSMTANATANLTSTRYVYDLEISSNNVVSRIVEGFVTVNPGVTR